MQHVYAYKQRSFERAEHLGYAIVHSFPLRGDWA